jgi:8-oxo-dGTP pyrophosphatase MutT (NUDIX family)
VVTPPACGDNICVIHITDLMIRRTDNGNWAVLGGAVDLGESVAQAAIRETLEESEIERHHRHRRHLLRPQARDPLSRQRRGTPRVLHLITAWPLSGQPTPSGESSDVRWIPPSELPGYTMDRSMRLGINDFLSRNEPPVIT